MSVCPVHGFALVPYMVRKTRLCILALKAPPIGALRSASLFDFIAPTGDLVLRQPSSLIPHLISTCVQHTLAGLSSRTTVVSPKEQEGNLANFLH